MNEQRTPIPCTTEQFWAAMCRTSFIRTGRHTGRIGLGVFTCDVPPEDVPGFLVRKNREMMISLGCSRHELACFDAAVAGLPAPQKRRWWQFWRKS